MTSEAKKTYASVHEEILALQIPRRKSITILLLSVISCFLVVLGPIAFCINMMIFVNYQRLYAFLIAMLAFFWLSSADIIYLKTLTKGKVKGLYHMWGVEMIYFFLLVNIILVIIYKIGVI